MKLGSLVVRFCNLEPVNKWRHRSLCRFFLAGPERTSIPELTAEGWDGVQLLTPKVHLHRRCGASLLAGFGL